MNENETLREQMWDLCYGLLSAEEVAALHKQIKSDPAAARLYAEVRLQADLVASAAKIEDVAVTLSVPNEGRKVQPAAKKRLGSGESPFQPKAGRPHRKSLHSPSYRVANWLAGLAATALVALIGYGFFAPARRGASPAEDQVVAYVYGNNSLQSGLSQTLKVVAKNRRGEPASTELSYHVYFKTGELALQDVVQTDQSGEAQFSLPGSAIQPGSRLEVQVQNDRQAAVRKGAKDELFRAPQGLGEESTKLVVPLLVKEEPVTTDVQLERDAYQAGETVRFRVHSWRAFSKQPALAADDWKLVAQDGREIEPANVESRPEAGNVSGEFHLPEDASAGEYMLVGIDRASGAWQELDQVAVGLEALSQGTNLRRSLAAKSNRQLDRLRELDALALARPTDKQSEPLDRKKRDGEKGKSELARGGEEPAPAAGAVPPPPAPAEASGSKPAPPAAPVAAAPQENVLAKNGVVADSASKTEARLEKGQMGPESLQERLSGNENKILRSEAKDRTVDAEEGVEFQGDSIQVQVPPEFAKRKLLVVVSKANAPVTTQEYDGASVNDSKKSTFSYSERRGGSVDQNVVPAKESAPNLAKSSKGSAEQNSLPMLLSLRVPPEADGDLEVTFYDQSVQPSQPVYRQQVRRESLRGLSIDVAALQLNGADFTPQKEMQLRFKVTDQGGKVVPNSWLSARIVKLDDQIARLDSKAPLRFAEGKAAISEGSGGRTLAPGGAGGGFGGGKGAPVDDVEAKELDSNDDQKKKALEREILAKQAKKVESKQDKTSDGTARPGELAAHAPPAAAAGPAEGGKSFGGGARPSQDESKLLEQADRPRKGGFGSSDSLQTNPEVYQLDLPQEVLLGSNDALIQVADQSEQAAAKSAHMNFQQWIGRIVLVVAVAALLLLGVLAILHQPAQAKVWVPAMAVVAGSLVVGSVWLLNGKMASMEVAGVPNVRLQGHPDFARNGKMDPALMADSEPAAATLENAPGMGGQVESFPLAGGTLEKFQGESGGPGIGPTVELPAGGFAPKSEALPKTAADPAGLPGPLGGAREAEKAPEPAPASKAEASAKPNEPKPGFTRVRTEASKESAELQKGDSPLAPPRPAAMKSLSGGADRDKRAPSPRLLWEPNLPANELGEAELNLRLPSEPGDYVLIVDVQGPYGVGTVQRHIPVRVPPAAPAAVPAAPPKP